MGIGRKAKQQSLTNTKLVGMRVQTSLNGKAITIVYGAQRIAANLIGYDDFTAVSQQQQQGGKGVVGGGGKGSAKSFVYYAAIQAALCEGPIQGLRHVWDSQGALTLLTTTDTFTVPGGGGTHTVVPPSGGTHVFDHGPSRGDAYSVGPFTDYGSSGPVTLSGTQQFPMFKVGSAPATGQYSVNTGTGAYTFGAGDAGKVMTITYTYSVPDSSSNGQPLTKLSLTLFPGNRPQSPWAYMVSKHPAKALGYNGLAYVANSSLFLGSSGQLPNLTYEVLGFLPFGAGVMDANPAAIIPDMLTSPVYGAGFPSGLLGDFTQYSKYCVANGLFLSVALDQTETSAAIIQRLMDITNSECVWNGAVLKTVPYGDTTVVGNGVTFSPNTTPLYDLNDDDFISPDQGEPVQLKIGSAIDAKNSVWVEFLDRSNNYNVSIVPAKDDGSINLIGLRNDPPHSWHEITTATVAALAADSLLRRKVYVRNAYVFTLGWRYAVLEPMDMVTLTDANLGLNKAPVRIIDISEDDKGNLQITAEEFPWGTASPTLYPKESNAGFQPASVVDPGNVNAPIIAEVNNRVTGQAGNQLWLGVSGQSVANWGGCHVWMSLDNATYKQIKDISGNDKIVGPARMGLLTVSFPSHADPDTVDTLTVDLAQSGGVLLSGTAADADGDRTLCLVDNELISYQTATLVTGNKYNLATRIRRGQLGSTIASHAINAPFLRLDDAVFKYQFDPLLIGQTVWFKFTSFNTAQNSEQGLASATAYSVTIAGTYKGAIDLSSGFINSSANPSLFMGPWNGAVAYLQGAEVSFQHNVFTALQASTGQTPPSPPATSAFWQLVGPDSLDAVNDGSVYIRGIQYPAVAIVVPNANFEASASLPVPGWTGSGATLSYDTVTPQSGNQSLKVTGISQFGGALSVQKWAVTPGDTYLVSGYVKSDGVGIPVIQLQFSDKNGASTGGVQVGGTTSTSWAFISASGTVPAGTVTAILGLQNNAATQPSAVEFDQIYAFRVVTLANEVGDGPSRFAATASTLTYRPTTNPLTGHDAGSNATINVAAFSMRTSSKGDVPDNSGSITALSYKTLYYIYYDDPTLAGGAVTYQATTTKESSIQGAGRFFVGSIVTPAATAPDTTGNNDGGVGAQAGQTSVFLFGSATSTFLGANTPAPANPQNAIDGSSTTFANLNVTFTSSEAESSSVTLLAAAPTSAPWASLKLYVASSVPTNTTGAGTGNCTFSISYSLDGGNSFTTIYSVTGPTTRAFTVDSISLPLNQNLALVRVQANMSRPTLNGNTGQQNLYEAWVVGLQ